MSRHPLDRLIAWLIDWMCILGWVAATAAVGVPLYLAGVTDGLGTGVLNVIATIVIVVPVTFALAKMESGPRGATIGKRVRGLIVRDAAGGPAASFGQSLIRNVFKVALPWTLGHWVAFELSQSAGGSVPPWMWLATALAYVLPLVYLASLFLGQGRTPYDRLSRTIVTARSLPSP
jgi:uncharacterized RDD family membrane protein YckC